MYPFSLSRSSSAAVTTVTSTSRPANASSMCRSPSGAARRQMAVTSRAPRSSSSEMAATSVPPVASIGSSTNTWRSCRSWGSRSAYVVARSEVSSRTMPRNPTSAVGMSFIIPLSMPSPARRMGTTMGRGSAISTPVVSATGVVMVTGCTRSESVASYARSVTSSSASSRNVAEEVSSRRSRVSLWATSGWSMTRVRMLPRVVVWCA